MVISTHVYKPNTSGVKIYFRASAWFKGVRDPHVFFASFITTDHIDPEAAVQDFLSDIEIKFKDVKRGIDDDPVMRFALVISAPVKGPDEPNTQESDLLATDERMILIDIRELVSFSVLDIVSAIYFDAHSK